MKATVNILIVLVFLASGCVSTYHVNNDYNDDIYYTPSAKKEEPKQTVIPVTREEVVMEEPQDRVVYDDYDYEEEPRQVSEEARERYTTHEEYTDDNGDTYVTNNYYGEGYDEDDYYDYAYSARIRRFHRSNIGCGYYDGYYTNAYWYNYDPAYWGVSIYLGYNWWRPSYGYYHGYSPYNYHTPHYYGSYHYNHWGAGYYGYSSSHHGYHHGYNHGYNDASNDNYYHNSFDGTSNYYGHRGNGVGVGSTGTRGTRVSRATSKSFAEKYNKEVTRTTGRQVTKSPASFSAVRSPRTATRLPAGRKAVDPLSKTRTPISRESIDKRVPTSRTPVSIKGTRTPTTKVPTRTRVPVSGEKVNEAVRKPAGRDINRETKPVNINRRENLDKAPVRQQDRLENKDNLRKPSRQGSDINYSKPTYKTNTSSRTNYNYAKPRVTTPNARSNSYSRPNNSRSSYQNNSYSKPKTSSTRNNYSSTRPRSNSSYSKPASNSSRSSSSYSRPSSSSRNYSKPSSSSSRSSSSYSRPSSSSRSSSSYSRPSSSSSSRSSSSSGRSSSYSSGSRRR